MNATRSFSSIRLLALGLVTLGLWASVARAQTCEGTFTLPFEASWGTAVLPAGDYSFKLETPSTIPYSVEVRGNGTGVLIRSTGISDRPVSGRSELVLVRRGGKARIRALHLTERGQTFHYFVPKDEPIMLAQAPELIQRVPVVVAGM